MRKSLLLALLGLTACSPQITKHQASYRFVPRLEVKAPYAAGPISVSAFAMDAPEVEYAAAPPLVTLSDQGQAELIKAVNGRLDSTVTADELIAILNSEPSTEDGGPAAHENLTRFTRRVVVSIDSDILPPADRLYHTAIRLHLLGGAKFTGWDKLSTQYETVDLGSLTFAQSATVTGNMGMSGPASEASVGAEASQELTESMNLSKRYQVLSGAITESDAVLVRQGVPGIDLTGNTTVDLDLEVAGAFETFHSFQGLFDSEGQAAAPEAVEKFETLATVPESASEPIRASLRVDYVLRRVEDGEHTIMEGDDTVTFERRFTALGQTSATSGATPFDLIPAEMLFRGRWSLRVDQVYLNIGGKWDAGGELKGDTSEIQFRTYDEAVEFRSWLEAKKPTSVTRDKLALSVGFARLTPAHIGVLEPDLQTNVR